MSAGIEEQANLAAVQGELDRRNRRMILGLFIALIVISALLFSGSLAKYTTENSGSDAGRVAYWGIEIDVADTGLFRTQYESSDDDYHGTHSVISSNDDYVLAPGTYGTASDFTISGAAEVATKVEVTVTPNTGLKGWTLEDSTPYEPVLWTLTKNGDPLVFEGSFDEMLAELEGIEEYHSPHTALEDASEYIVSWHWPFESGTDHHDTELANKEVAPSVHLGFDVTVSQID